METKTKESQTARILKLLKEKKTVSNRELNRICFRYGARLFELRKEGHIIVTDRVKDSLYNFHYQGHVDDAKETADIW